MTTEHTPGPWQRFSDGGAISSGATYGPGYADCVWGPKGPGHGIIADCSPHGQPATKETIANATLIAAAPILLTSLNALVEAVARARKADDNVYRAATDPSEALFDEQEDAHATLIICENKARAAIAKARGQKED